MYPFIKSIIDRIVAIVALIVLSPILLIIAILLKLSSIKTVFFIHPRPGLHGKQINVYKFKTMNDKRDNHGNLLPNHERITKLGAFLRRSSLDEIPQLINVVKGDMSFIGPRPLEMRYLPYYTKEQNRRHDVKPGISGWAQVNGRNAISWEQKFEYDLYYVDNQSFWFDLKIVALTVKKVLAGSDINASQNQTVEPFDVYLNRKKNGT
jgi:lipopolysaccharide/colanic/teichoic acid biosynthesis glycosyltransferase